MSSHQWLRIILHRSMSTLAAQTSSHLALCAEEQHESYGAPLFRFRRFLLEQIRQQYAETCIHIDNNMLRRVSTSTAICRDVYLHDVYILHIKRIYTFQRNPGPRLTNPQNLRYQSKKTTYVTITNCNVLDAHSFPHLRETMFPPTTYYGIVSFVGENELMS